ncbi:MAG: endolytic transglycosylase MltG [Pseudomonadota bacterium]|nr:endolytic transglycosylase MltG [Pseudomonadota bacterium]
MNRAARRLWPLIVLLLSAAAAIQIWTGWRSLDEPLNVAAPLRFKVAAGARFAHVAADLAAQGVVAWPRVWVLYARGKRLAAAIKAGEYEIEPGTTPRQLLEKMVSGQVLLHSLTVVDGWRVQDMLSAMRRNPDIVSTLPPGKPTDLMATLGFPGLDAEGQFLPETYRFPSGATDLDLLRQAHAALAKVLNAAWMNRDMTIPLHSADELLIMASIVEKESGLPEELPKIAGLYLHRLSIGMRLQADPTIIYGLGESYDGDLHTVDLHTDTPYNTYTRPGLPPTAIALPGAAAIEATAHPDKTDALYFVASAKGDGSHVFSATLEQHNAAVAQYLARLRQRAAAEPAR